MDIKKYNLINGNIEIMPNYSVQNRERSIWFYLNRKGKVLIFGRVDNNYIYWASLSDSKEKEKNEAIFNYIANQPYERISQEYLVWNRIKIFHEDLKLWYLGRIERALEPEMEWRTPFGHYYGKNQILNNGKYFAEDISCYLDVILRKCRLREANGTYEKVLDSYIEKLKETKGDAFRYLEFEYLDKMMREEDYLILSGHKNIRRKYAQICEKMRELYNQYMSAVR